MLSMYTPYSWSRPVKQVQSPWASGMSLVHYISQMAWLWTRTGQNVLWRQSSLETQVPYWPANSQLQGLMLWNTLSVTASPTDHLLWAGGTRPSWKQSVFELARACVKRRSQPGIVGWAVLEWPSRKLDFEIFEDCLSAKIGPLENFPLYGTFNDNCFKAYILPN